MRPVSRPRRIAATSFLAGLCATALSGCVGGPSVSGAAKLARLKPLEADPAAIRFAVRSPQFLDVREGDITVTVSYDGGTEATRFLEKYKPVVTRSQAGAPGIDMSGFGSDTLTVARLDEDDAAGLAAFQQRVRALREDGIEGKGSFSIGATGCRTGAVPPGPVLISAWMQTAPSDDFFQVVRGADLRRQLDAAGVGAESIPAC